MKILEFLKKIEKKENIKIIYACETGSRIYGYNIPESDYDIRFIYIKNKKEYFKFSDEHSVIKGNEGKFEYKGMDVKKVLENISKSKMEIETWFRSPKVYIKTETSEKIKKLLPKYFSEKELYFHYLGYNEKLSRMSEEEALKAKDYIISGIKVLALEIYEKTGKLPENEHIEKIESNSILYEYIKEIAKKRMAGNEMQLNKEAVKLLKEKHEKLKQKAFQMKSNVKNPENAEKLFMEIVMELQK